MGKDENSDDYMYEKSLKKDNVATCIIPLSYKSKLIGQHIGIRCYTSYTASQVTERNGKNIREAHCLKFYIASHFVISSWTIITWQVIETSSSYMYLIRSRDNAHSSIKRFSPQVLIQQPHHLLYIFH